MVDPTSVSATGADCDDIHVARGVAMDASFVDVDIQGRGGRGRLLHALLLLSWMVIRLSAGDRLVARRERVTIQVSGVAQHELEATWCIWLFLCEFHAPGYFA